MMALTRYSGRHVPPQQKPMLWYGYGAIVSVAVAIVVGVLASSAVGVIPESVGWIVGAAAVASALVLMRLDGLVMRRRDRDRYWNAGFIVEPANHRQRIDDLIFFRILSSGIGYSDCYYWLPEAPQARAYDFFYRLAGKVHGHIVIGPTSAPDGVAARHTSPEVVPAKVNMPGPLVTDASGVVRSLGEQHDDLVRALPPWPGILVVRQSRARWLTFERLTPDDIKDVIASLQRLPPPAGDSADSTPATRSDHLLT